MRRSFIFFYIARGIFFYIARPWQRMGRKKDMIHVLYPESCDQQGTQVQTNNEAREQFFILPIFMGRFYAVISNVCFMVSFYFMFSQKTVKESF